MSDLLRVPISGVGSGVLLLKRRCNIFGDATNGAVRVLGGLNPGKVTTQWYCPREAEGRFRMECAHGHRGQVMLLCSSHLRQYSGGKVQFCPRCNADPDNHHRCGLTMISVS